MNTNLKSEEWRSISGYEGHYEISSLGRVRSLDRYCRSGRLRRARSRRCFPSWNGYLQVQFRVDRVIKLLLVHRLVATNFLGEPPFPGATVNHKDGDKLNNSVENLEWCSQTENLRHARRMGLNRAEGERHYLTKLTAEYVQAIRAWVRTGATRRDIAALYAVDRGVIDSIARGQTFKSVPNCESEGEK